MRFLFIALFVIVATGAFASPPKPVPGPNHGAAPSKPIPLIPLPETPK